MICAEDRFRRRPGKSTAQINTTGGVCLDGEKNGRMRPKHRPITKIMLPDGVKGDTAPLAVGTVVRFPEFGGCLEMSE